MKLKKKMPHDFRNMRGWGSKAVWNFFENSSVLVSSLVPKRKQLHFSQNEMIFIGLYAVASFLLILFIS